MRSGQVYCWQGVSRVHACKAIAFISFDPLVACKPPLEVGMHWACPFTSRDNQKEPVKRSVCVTISLGSSVQLRTAT